MRCKDCLPTDEEARVIAEAFGLPSRVHTVDSEYSGHAFVNGAKADEKHIAMWHALVRCYDVLQHVLSRQKPCASVVELSQSDVDRIQVVLGANRG